MSVHLPPVGFERLRYSVGRFFLHLGLSILPHPYGRDLTFVIEAWVKKSFTLKAKP